MSQIDVLLAAGGESKPDDPLASLTRGQPKAMLPIAGKPMAQWVLDAVAGSRHIGQVVAVGLGPEHGLTCGDKAVHYIPSAGSMVDNARAGIKQILSLNPNAKYALWVSADIPALRAEHIDWMLETCLQTDHDAYYNVIEKAVMEARFPASRRSYVRLKDRVVCGGDMTLFATRLVQGENTLWRKITEARKSALKQAALIGFETLFLLFIRQLTLEHAVELVGKRLGLRGRALLCPFAEVGMDVDKPFQYEIMLTDLGRAAPAGPSPGEQAQA